MLKSCQTLIITKKYSHQWKSKLHIQSFMAFTVKLEETGNWNVPERKLKRRNLPLFTVCTVYSMNVFVCVRKKDKNFGIHRRKGLNLKPLGIHQHLALSFFHTLSWTVFYFLEIHRFLFGFSRRNHNHNLIFVLFFGGVFLNFLGIFLNFLGIFWTFWKSIFIFFERFF